ncbi:MAG: hypothetical protein AB8B69_23430, partial [Chitinophagales bacterium]
SILEKRRLRYIPNSTKKTGRGIEPVWRLCKWMLVIPTTDEAESQSFRFESISRLISDILHLKYTD